MPTFCSSNYHLHFLTNIIGAIVDYAEVLLCVKDLEYLYDESCIEHVLRSVLESGTQDALTFEVREILYIFCSTFMFSRRRICL